MGVRCICIKTHITNNQTRFTNIPTNIPTDLRLKDRFLGSGCTSYRPRLEKFESANAEEQRKQHELAFGILSFLPGRSITYHENSHVEGMIHYEVLGDHYEIS